jgi:hypothetical protein
MKWTNKGHELDELGIKYMQVKNLYIWGAGWNGIKCLEFLRWLNIDKDFGICFIDSDTNKQSTYVCGIKVISPNELYALPDNVKAMTAIVVTPYRDCDKILSEISVSFPDTSFFWQMGVINSANKNNGFVRNFVCTFLLYKYNKLLSHWTNYLATTKCSLNCKGCLNMTNYIKQRCDTPLSEFKSHIDTVFSKYDYLYAFHFTGGEPLLCKELPEMMEYVVSKYGDRIWDVFCLTNGTILPNERVITVSKKYNYRFAITNYTESAPNFKEILTRIITTFENNGIPYSIGKPTEWADLEMGIADWTYLSEAELIEHHDDCNLFWHSFQNGAIYTCSYPSYAETAGLYKVTPDDFIDILSATKHELLEFEFGYCNKGYGGLCRHCNGFGKRTKIIPFAEQL